MIDCPICGSEAIKAAAGLCRCCQCTHLFQHPPVVTVRYDARYLSTYEEYPTRLMGQLRAGFLKAFISGGRLLDVGYGNGDFVRAALAAGFDAYGADVHGVDCGVREVDLRSDALSWDVVTLFDSLEHFPDFLAVRRLLPRTKYVMVSLPLPPPEFPEHTDWKHFKPGEHLHYFSPMSLARLINRPLLRESNLEDSIRRGAPGRQNILTAMFGPEE